MYEEISQAITEIVRFTNGHSIEAEFHIHTAGQLQGDEGVPDKYWARFEERAGVYVIFDCDDGGVYYIGMSKRDTGSRLYGWMYESNRVNEAVGKNDLVLSVVLENEPYMSPALESYLIDKMDPSLNKKAV